MYKDLQKSIVNVFFMDRIHHGNLMDGSPQKWRFGKRFSCEKLGDLLSSTSIFKGCSGGYFDITYSPWWISIATHRINWWLFVANFWRIRKKLPPIAPLVFFSGGTWGVGKSPFYALFFPLSYEPQGMIHALTTPGHSTLRPGPDLGH